MGENDSGVAVCIGDGAHIILDCDDAYMELLQKERSEIVGRHPLQLTYKADRMSNLALLGKLADTGRAFLITKRYELGGGGGLAWVTNHVSAFQDGLGSARSIATSRLVARPPIAMHVANQAKVAKQLSKGFASIKAAFGSYVMSAPMAELILELYLVELEGRCIDGHALAEVIQQSDTLTLRWLDTLHYRNIIVLEDDRPLSLSSAFRLSDECQGLIDRLLVVDDIQNRLNSDES